MTERELLHTHLREEFASRSETASKEIKPTTSNIKDGSSTSNAAKRKGFFEISAKAKVPACEVYCATCHLYYGENKVENPLEDQ